MKQKSLLRVILWIKEKTVLSILKYYLDSHNSSVMGSFMPQFLKCFFKE